MGHMIISFVHSEADCLTGEWKASLIISVIGGNCEFLCKQQVASQGNPLFWWRKDLAVTKVFLAWQSCCFRHDLIGIFSTTINELNSTRGMTFEVSSLFVRNSLLYIKKIIHHSLFDYCQWKFIHCLNSWFEVFPVKWTLHWKNRNLGLDSHEFLNLYFVIIWELFNAPTLCFLFFLGHKSKETGEKERIQKLRHG